MSDVVDEVAAQRFKRALKEVLVRTFVILRAMKEAELQEQEKSR